MKNKKIDLVIIVLLLIIIFVSGCVNNKSDIDNTSIPETTKQPSESSTSQSSDDEDLVIIELTATNYSYSLETIRVNKGQKVKVILKIIKGTHDWVVDEFGAATERKSTGKETSVEFIADKTGEFFFYCSIGNHRALGMEGKLIVE